MSRERDTFPTDSTWLLEHGTNVTNRDHEVEGQYDEAMRDALETMHSPKCESDLCHPDCDFCLLIAHYYEGLSVQELAERYGHKLKGSAWYRLDRARQRLKQKFIETNGNPFE